MPQQADMAATVNRLPYGVHARLTQAAQRTIGDLVLKSRENRSVPTTDRTKRESGKVFEAEVVFSALVSHVDKSRSVKAAIASEADPLGWSCERAGVVLPVVNSQGKRPEHFWDLLIDADLRDPDGKAVRLVHPVNVKYAKPDRARAHIGSGEMLQWLFGRHTVPETSGTLKVDSVRSMMVDYVLEHRPLYNGPYGPPSELVAPTTDHGYLWFAKSTHPKRWADARTSTSLLSVDPRTALAWVNGERWPRLHIKLHAPADPCATGMHRPRASCRHGHDVTFRRLLFAMEALRIERCELELVMAELRRAGQL